MATQKPVAAVLVCVAIALWLFPALAATGIVAPAAEHEALITKEAGGRLHFPVFVSHSKDRTGATYKAITHTAYFVPRGLRMVSITTIDQTDREVISNVEDSQVYGL